MQRRTRWTVVGTVAALGVSGVVASSALALNGSPTGDAALMPALTVQGGATGGATQPGAAEPGPAGTVAPLPADSADTPSSPTSPNSPNTANSPSTANSPASPASPNSPSTPNSPDSPND